MNNRGIRKITAKRGGAKIKENRPDISVIVVTYNSADVITDFLDSLNNVSETLDLNMETIVTDNASKDATVRNLDEARHHARLNLEIVLNKRNLGLSRAMNEAIAKSKGRKLLICNPDISFTNSIGKMLELAEKNPEVIVVPQLYQPNGRFQGIIYRRFPTALTFISENTLLRIPILSKRIVRNLAYFGRTYDGLLEPIEHTSAVCMLVDRSVADRLSPFYDPALPVYWNDVDMSKRAALLGIRSGIVTKATVYHKLAHSVATSDPEMIAMLRYSSAGLIGYAKKWGMHPNLIRFVLLLDATGHIALELPKRLIGRKTRSLRSTHRLPSIKDATKRSILPFRCSIR